MTDAELRALVLDCVALWNLSARVVVTDAGVTIQTADGTFLLQRAAAAQRPVRWLLQTPTRAAANRPPRVAPSIVAALSALRNAIGGDPGSTLRVGPAGATPA
ncbi:MAG TPA: hypothetical protein VGG99_28215 [Acetobacteraceae bacterium]|jgi:hypothetical protein